MATDVTITKAGEIALFTYTSDNLASPVAYLGATSNRIAQSLSKNKGSLEPVIAPDSEIPNRFNIIDEIRGAPELGEFPIEERLHPAAASYLNTIYRTDCRQTALIKVDACGNKSDLASFSKIIIVIGMRINDISFDDLMSFDENTLVSSVGNFSIRDFDEILPLNFARYADDDILAEVLDVVYADALSCGACTPYSTGCDKVYALTRANTGSPGLSGQLVYSTDGYATWTVADIQSLGGKQPNHLEAVGQYLVVTSEADGAHHYALKSNPTAGNWTRVATGYQVGGAPRAIFALSATQVFINGAGGFIYRSEDVTTGVTVVHDGSSTVQNGNDIHGNGLAITSVHNSNTVMISVNGGISFGLITTTAGLTGPEAGANLLTVAVISQYQAYIGTSTGKLWYTTDGYLTFTQRALPNQGNIAAILDIKFSTEIPDVGAVAVQMTNGTGKVYRTVTGGRTWFSADPATLPTNERINAVALCGLNSIVAVGKQSGATDGLIAIALA